MIVRPAVSGCILITQPDHAQLARRIMEHCVMLVGNPRRDAILRAIGDHDNGWAGTDAAPMADPVTGEVLDFITVPMRVRQGVWPLTISGLADEPYAAALVANHAMFAYDRYREHPEWLAFFATMDQSRREMLQASGYSMEQLLEDYAFLRLGDLISLAFCTGSTAAQTFRDWTVQLVGPRVAVTPGIFGGAPVTFEISARAVRPPFGSTADLQKAVGRAASTMIQGEAA